MWNCFSVFESEEKFAQVPRGGKFGKTGVVFSPHHSRIAVCLVALAATRAEDAEKREIKVKKLQEELESLQKNYIDLQHLYMEPFVPKIDKTRS